MPPPKSTLQQKTFYIKTFKKLFVCFVIYNELMLTLTAFLATYSESDLINVRPIWET
jgi:hypothetical protein